MSEQSAKQQTYTLNDERYAVERELGHGGFAQVMLATRESDKKQVALKLVSRNNPEYEQFREMEARGVQIARRAVRVGVTGLVEVFDYGEIDAGFVIAMTYVPGGTLEELIENEEPPPLERALSIVEKVGATLAALHGHDIIHRDLNPRNVLLDGEDVLISDFGTLRYQQTRMARTSLGVVGFTAPECVDPRKVVGPPADVYTLGALTFYLLTGISPEHREEHLHQLPANVREVVVKACRYNPKDRYGDVQGLVIALRQPPRISRKVIVAAVLVALIAGLGVAAWFLFQQDPATPATVVADARDLIAYSESGEELWKRQLPRETRFLRDAKAWNLVAVISEPIAAEEAISAGRTARSDMALFDRTTGEPHWPEFFLPNGTNDPFKLNQPPHQALLFGECISAADLDGDAIPEVLSGWHTSYYPSVWFVHRPDSLIPILEMWTHGHPYQVLTGMSSEYGSVVVFIGAANHVSWSDQKRGDSRFAQSIAVYRWKDLQDRRLCYGPGIRIGDNPKPIAWYVLPRPRGTLADGRWTLRTKTLVLDTESNTVSGSAVFLGHVGGYDFSKSSSISYGWELPLDESKLETPGKATVTWRYSILTGVPKAVQELLPKEVHWYAPLTLLDNGSDRIAVVEREAGQAPIYAYRITPE